MTDVHLLRVSCADLRLLVRVNGIDVIEERLGHPREREKKIDPLLVADENRVEIFLAPRLDEAGATIAPGPDAGCTVQVLCSDMDMVDPVERTLLSYTWRRGAMPSEESTEVPVFSGAFRPAFARGPWLWEAVEPRPFTPEDAPGLIALIDAIHASLVVRDISALQRILRTKHTELGRALGIPLERIEGEMAGFLGEVMAPTDWAVPRPDPQGLRVQSWAEGRLLSIMDALGRPPLVGTSSTGQFALPVVVTRAEGSWVVVR